MTAPPARFRHALRAWLSHPSAPELRSQSLYPSPPRQPGTLSGFGSLQVPCSDLRVARLAANGLAGVLLSSLVSRAAHAASSVAPAGPAWWSWLLAGLAVVALALLLACWQQDRLEDVWHWLVVNIGGLLAPLRSRRHVIHDPGYLRQIVEAELEVNPELAGRLRSRRSSLRSGRGSAGRRIAFRGRRRRGSS